MKAATISSYGVNAKLYGLSNGLKLSALAIAKSKSELSLKRQITHITDLQKLFPSYDFQFK